MQLVGCVLLWIKLAFRVITVHTGIGTMDRGTWMVIAREQTRWISAAIPLILCVSQAQAENLLELRLDQLMNVRVASTSYFDETLLDAANSITYVDQARWQELGVRDVGEL